MFGFYKIWRPEPIELNESYIMELIFSKTCGQLRLEFCSWFTALSWYIIWLSVPLSFLQKVEDAEDSRTRKVILFLIYPMWQCGCILQLEYTSHHITIGCTQEKIWKKDIRLGNLIPLLSSRWPRIKARYRGKKARSFLRRLYHSFSEFCVRFILNKP